MDLRPVLTFRFLSPRPLSALATVALAVALLASLIFGFGGADKPVQATGPGAPEAGFDMVNTGNTGSSLGTIDTCVSVPATIGGTFTIDTFLDAVPAAEDLDGWAYAMAFPDTVVKLITADYSVSMTPTPSFSDLSEGAGLPGPGAGDDLVSPQGVTIADFGVGTPAPAGTVGVLGRYTFQVTAATVGSYTFSFGGLTNFVDSGIGIGDWTGLVSFGSYGIGTLALGQPCVQPVDVAVSSVSTSSPPSAGVGVPFNVQANVTAVNLGPASPVNTDTTVTLSLPADCSTGSPNPAIVNDVPLVTGPPTALPPQTWSVTCTTVITGAQEPAKNAAGPVSDGGGIILRSPCPCPAGGPDAYLHSGEFVTDDVDLVIPGRGIDWKFERKYRSASTTGLRSFTTTATVQEDDAGAFETNPANNALTSTVSGSTNVSSVDADGDTILDASDNCPTTVNPEQTNTDAALAAAGASISGDPQGDACDTDDDNDGAPDTVEIYIATDPLSNCRMSGAAGVGHDAWSLDNNANGAANVSDVLAYKGATPQAVPPGRVRLNINGDSTLNVSDILMFKGQTPQTCTPASTPVASVSYGASLDGPLGHNWEFNYSRRLILSVPGDLTSNVIRADGSGRRDTYVRQPDGSYTAPTGFYTKLVKNGDNTFTEHDASGSVVQYAPPDVNGIARMASLGDRNGNTMTFTYDGSGQLIQVKDTLGRNIDYSYDLQGHLRQVTDFAGRRLRFLYDGNGDLVKVISPAVTGTPNGNNFPDGRQTRYSYSAGSLNPNLNHNLLSIRAPNETPSPTGAARAILTYDSNDRVASQAIGGTNGSGVPTGGTISYDYAPSGSCSAPAQTCVTDRNGNRTDYSFNALGNITRVEEFTNRNVSASDPASYVTTSSYNSDGERLVTTLPEGNTQTGVYDSGSSARLQQGNSLSSQLSADGDRGGDQASISSTQTYEPVYNQVRTTVEPRGNDGSYVPQNGGAQSAARYRTAYTFDYQEACDFAAIGAKVGLTAVQAQALLTAAGMCSSALGDVNGDGVTNQVNGNVIRIQQPNVNLLAGSNQATVEGSTVQPVVKLIAYNQFGQETSSKDPEANVDVREYYPENDPDGDGTINNPSGNTLTGGYLKQTTSDTASAAIRNSGTNPTPVSIRNRYSYDPAGNVTRTVDGRGIATDYAVNQLNQVVQTKRAAALNVYAPDPVEPGPLTAFQYLERVFYDFNGNVVLRQVEDRGNTSNVDGNPPTVDLPATASNPDPAGGVAYGDTVYKYDVLDKRIEVLAEAANGGGAEFLRARYRYDRNENLVLVIQPEGNAASSVYDERDLLFQTTTGTLTPPPANCPSPAPCALMAGADPTNYDVRGGLPSTGTYHYDANGSLIETVDADDTDSSAANNSGLGGAGDRTRYIYDGFDRLTSVVDSAGNQSVTQYDPAGNIVRVSRFGPTGGTSPTSDGPGTLLRPVSSAGTIQSGNLVTANLLESTESRFDELSRGFQTDRALFVNTIATVRAPDVDDGAASIGKGDLTPGDTCAVPGISGPTYLGCVSSRSEYDRSSRGTFTVEDDTNTSRAFYGGAGRVIKTLDAEGNTVETAYDDNSNAIETKETDVSQVGGVASEVFLTTYFYDSLNRLERDISNIGQTNDYRYDSRSNLVCMADAQGPAGPAITRRAFSGGALTVNTTNLFGNVTQYFYDGLGRSVREETILTATGQGDGANIGCTGEGVKTATPAPDITQGGGDGLIRVGSLWDRNALQSALLDDQGNITVYLYDNLGRRITETKGLTVNTTPLDKTKILGARNVLTPTPATINTPASISAALITTQLTAAKTRINAVASLFPSLAGVVTDAPPTTIVWGYDPDGNLLILEDENDSETFSRFDALNRAIAVRVFRSGQSDTHAGDPVFAPAPASDPSNPSTSFPAIIGTTKQDYQYDGLSRLVRGADNNDPSPTADDSIVTDAYDSLGRTIEETQKIGALPAKAVSTSWRAENLRSEMIYPQSGSFSRQLDYTYDALDRTDTVKDDGAAQDITNYDYIGQGRVLQRSYPINGTRLTYLNNAGATDAGYDGARRTVQLRHLRSDNSLVAGFTHTYDRMNNKLGEVKLHNAANDENYGYDAAYRLTNFDRPGGGAIAPLHDNWQLDGAGNWDQVTSTESGSPVVETRQHSSVNEITGRNPGTALTVLSDDNGNEYDDGKLLLTWDYGNRLRQVNRKSDSALLAVYTYDAAGRRVRKVVSNSGALDGTTDFYLDGWQEIEERNGSDALVQQYVYGGTYIDEPLVLDRNLGGGDSAIGGGDQRLFYHQNTLYSTFALTDTAGVIKEGYQYDAYGRQVVYAPGANSTVDFGGDDVVSIGGSSALANPYLYTGRRLDAETGLYYYRARYLNVEQGRFVSRDPVHTSNASSLYQYVSSGPTLLVDPLGLVEYDMKELDWQYSARPLPARPKHATSAMTIPVELTVLCICACPPGQKIPQIKCALTLRILIVIDRGARWAQHQQHGDWTLGNVYGHEQRHVINMQAAVKVAVDAQATQFEGGARACNDANKGAATTALVKAAQKGLGQEEGGGAGHAGDKGAGGKPVPGVPNEQGKPEASTPYTPVKGGTWDKDRLEDDRYYYRFPTAYPKNLEQTWSAFAIPLRSMP